MKPTTCFTLEDLSFDTVLTDAEADTVGGRGGSHGHYPGGRRRHFRFRFVHRRGRGHDPMVPSMPLPSGPIPVEPDLPDGSPNPGNFPPSLPPFAMTDGETKVFEVSGDGFHGVVSFGFSAH